MKKQTLGIILGTIAGMVDVTPMLLQKLTWDACISAFSMWVVIGFLISIVDLKINAIIKGILLAFMVLLPTAILIGWKEPVALIPISIMTLLLGGVLGFSFQKLSSEKE